MNDNCESVYRVDFDPDYGTASFYMDEGVMLLDCRYGDWAEPPESFSDLDGPSYWIGFGTGLLLAVTIIFVVLTILMWRNR